MRGNNHKKKSGNQATPQIVTYQIPKIEVYQVTDGELSAIEAGHGQVGQDFTIATNSLSLAVALIIALKTGTFSLKWTLLFEATLVACIFASIYTGARWFMTKGTLPQTISEIRSRKVAEDILPPTPKAHQEGSSR